MEHYPKHIFLGELTMWQLKLTKEMYCILHFFYFYIARIYVQNENILSLSPRFMIIIIKIIIKIKTASLVITHPNASKRIY